MPLPLIALVGRPNVGKSTLFNRLVGQRLAIVEDIPGTTRDRLYAAGDWGGYDYVVVDTGGLAENDEHAYAESVRNQALVAIEEADVVVLMTDAGVGVTAGDVEVAQMLRRSGKPLVLAVNKAEKRTRALEASEFWSLGIGEPILISAIQGIGVGDLLDVAVSHLPRQELDAAPDDRMRLAIIGRPNVGKSSILNRLVGSERAVVSATAGTTRDAVDTTLKYHGQEIVLVDTAGIRRRGRIERGIEKYSVLRAMRALERADVAVLVIDAVDGVTAQDAHIGGYLQAAGVGAIVAINKWDLVEKDTGTSIEVERRARDELKHLDYAHFAFISAVTGQRVIKVVELALSIHASRQQRVSTAELNRLVAELQARHTLSRSGRPLKIKYATQVSTAPPHFVLFVNDTELVHFSYERYVINQIRERFGFAGTPIKLTFRSGDKREETDAKARRGHPRPSSR
ncbi:MAG: ribosome biogenesis GTPase Der [Ardenticatenales bacterium]